MTQIAGIQHIFVTHWRPCPSVGSVLDPWWGLESSRGPRSGGPSWLWPPPHPVSSPLSPVALHYRAQSHFEERWILAQIYFCKGRSAWLTSAGEQEEFSGVAQFPHPKNSVFLKPICLNWYLQLWKNQPPRPCRIFFPHIVFGKSSQTSSKGS